MTGRSPLASNCRDATWIGASAMVMDGDKPRMTESSMPEVVVVFLSIDDCKILDTWYVMGMRGTGSDDIAVTDAFVPQCGRFQWLQTSSPDLTLHSCPWAYESRIAGCT